MSPISFARLAQRQHRLCKLLAATGVAGNPDSYFHRPSISDWLVDFGCEPGRVCARTRALEAIFRTAIAKGALDTGIFGLRLQRHSFDFFTEKLAVLYPEHSNDVERFQAGFGRTLFVHPMRRVKVAQAVSYVKAQQAGLWPAERWASIPGQARRRRAAERDSDCGVRRRGRGGNVARDGGRS